MPGKCLSKPQIASIVLLTICTSPVVAEDLTGEQVEFFENRIRPVLAEACYSCHNSNDTAEADLALDHRDGIRRATQNGTAVIPGDLEKSLLLQVIRHEIEGLEMPEGGAKLTDAVVADFQEWIRMGAPDPRDEPPSADDLDKATAWPAKLNQRKQWWSLQPIRNPAVPKGGPNDSPHPVDRFVAEKLTDHDLQPAPPADKRTLVRRLSYALLGLPPSRGQIESYLTNQREDAFEELVDQMLASEHFGEHWARHWMDLVRYADSHGSEGDPTIPHAYRYRDYLIRAFNNDVPYDQLVREQIAGDILPSPRINDRLGINESKIGPAQLRFVFHGFAPTDALDEKVRFTDDQINVISKAFLGMTVSCARCHDHKFDAISQADYYAWFGILGSPRPALVDANTAERQEMHKDRLREIKQSIRNVVSKHWLRQIESEEFLPTNAEEGIERFKDSALMKPWLTMATHSNEGSTATKTWMELVSEWQEDQQRLIDDAQVTNTWHWDLKQVDDYSKWFPDGNGLPSRPSRAGDFAVAHEGTSVISSVMPGGVHSHSLSSKHRGFLSSPRIFLNDDYNIWLRVQGNRGATVRYSVQHYPRDGTVYPIREINRSDWGWQHLNVDYWQGDHIHLEINTGQDAPVRVRGDERSWFGIREVVIRKKGLPSPPENAREFLKPVFDLASPNKLSSLAEISSVYKKALSIAVDQWHQEKTNDEQALLLNEAIRDELLANDIEDIKGMDSIIAAYRELERAIPLPTRVPGVVEADSFDQPLFDRGNHRNPLEPVERRFLEAIDATPYKPHDSGRLKLAHDLTRPENPLSSRVATNRIWQYLFGRGIVDTPDNFGRLGSLPSHPDLLDYLATHFQRNGWSLKKTIRFLVTSDTWQRSSAASSTAQRVDPQNRWLSHAHIRRLEAESIRDSLLAVTGQLDRKAFGSGFGPNSNATRRAVYVTARRNNLDPFLAVFDAPVPFATTGRRSVTNVPAQSLTMLNDPFVRRLAAQWGNNSVQEPPVERISKMFESAFGRPAETSEVKSLLEYLSEVKDRNQQQQQRRKQLEQQITKHQQTIKSILDPVRESLLAIARDSETNATARDSGLSPVSAWYFESDLSDAIGNLHGAPRGDAKIEDGALILDGHSFAVTPPLDRNLAEKTLEVWVQLANLEQQGGGAISVQTLNGVTFDAIVYGEREARKWIAGSDGFRRTQDFDGPSESEATRESELHIAITYSADGTIRGFRNGKPYGKPIRKSELVTFRKDDTQILFGLRHGNNNPSRMLAGKILQARLYDRALTSEEIAASFHGTSFITENSILAELTPEARQIVMSTQARLDENKQELANLGTANDEQDPWALMAHAIFNMKEFIYIR